uniref:C2H2-type domain-containing protein n=1 Tax=Macrostomum lignano TaxID=282301 RepID=A0A1I8F3M2_9PLAT
PCSSQRRHNLTGASARSQLYFRCTQSVCRLARSCASGVEPLDGPAGAGVASLPEWQWLVDALPGQRLGGRHRRRRRLLAMARSRLSEVAFGEQLARSAACSGEMLAAQHNLLAHQRGSQLYFRCTQSVPAGEELRFALNRWMARLARSGFCRSGVAGRCVARAEAGRQHRARALLQPSAGVHRHSRPAEGPAVPAPTRRCRTPRPPPPQIRSRGSCRQVKAPPQSGQSELVSSDISGTGKGGRRGSASISSIRRRLQRRRTRLQPAEFCRRLQAALASAGLEFGCRRCGLVMPHPALAGLHSRGCVKVDVQLDDVASVQVDAAAGFADSLRHGGRVDCPVCCAVLQGGARQLAQHVDAAHSLPEPRIAGLSAPATSAAQPAGLAFPGQPSCCATRPQAHGVRMDPAGPVFDSCRCAALA